MAKDKNSEETMMFAKLKTALRLTVALSLTAPALQAAPAIDVSPVAVGSVKSPLPAGWNREATFMEIFVRSYQDSDGDGIGDFKGLTSRLDYLKDLGVTGIWLMPINPAQDRDHGYAVEDYRAVNPDYGTMQDFETFLSEAHKRGIGVIIDYVINHSAKTNPIFQDAGKSKKSAYRDWYIFADTLKGLEDYPKGTWRPVAMDRSTEQGYAYSLFDFSMPDWNLKNPKVVDYHADNFRFWLNKGVDGFRIDAVTMLIENGPKAFMDQPENHPILARLSAVLNQYDNRYLVCEASERPTAYVGTGSCMNAFAFGTQVMIKDTARKGVLNEGLVKQLKSPMRKDMPMVLQSHDAYVGDRLINDLTGHDGGDYRVAAAIAILASDSLFSYYGEEIGMANNGIYNDPGLRAPMSWTGELPAAGFSKAKPYRALALNYAEANVASEVGQPKSLLEYYRALYKVRQSLPVLRNGDFFVQSAPGDTALIFVRTSAAAEVAVAINLSDKPQDLTIQTASPHAEFIDALRLPDQPVMAPVKSDDYGRITVRVAAQRPVVLTPVP